jgi:hypothetical protein
MPPVIAWSAGAVGATLLAKLVVSQWRRVNADLERMRTVPVRKAERDRMHTLRRDPQTGVYRP